MLEAAHSLETPDQLAEAPGDILRFQLRQGVSNSRVGDALRHFEAQAFVPSATSVLVGLFEPIVMEGPDEASLITPSDESPISLWDQVGRSYSRFGLLDQTTKDNVRVLTHYLLDALANEPQERKIQGTSRDLSINVRNRAQQVLKDYDAQLTQWLEPKATYQAEEFVRHTAAVTASGATAAFLVACSVLPPPSSREIPPTTSQAVVTLSAEATATTLPTPSIREKTATPAILATSTEVLSGFTPPVNVPEFVPSGAGGAFPEAIQQQAQIDRYRALLVLARQNGITISGATDQEVYAQLDSFAGSKSIEVKQEWNNGTGNDYQMASINIQKQTDGSQLVYWYATPGGALSARPDIPSTLDSTLVGVFINDGFHPEWRWGNDRNVYMFIVDDATGVATAWFDTTKADALAEGGFVDAWQFLIEPATATPEVMTVERVVEAINELYEPATVNEVSIDTTSGTMSWKTGFSKGNFIRDFYVDPVAQQKILKEVLGSLAWFAFKYYDPQSYPEYAGNNSYTGVTGTGVERLMGLVDKRWSKPDAFFTTDILSMNDTFMYDFTSENGGIPSGLPLRGLETLKVTYEEFTTISELMKNLPHVRIRTIPGDYWGMYSVQEGEEESLVFLQNDILFIVQHNEIQTNAPLVIGFGSSKSYLNGGGDKSFWTHYQAFYAYVEPLRNIPSGQNHLLDDNQLHSLLPSGSVRIQTNP